MLNTKANWPNLNALSVKVLLQIINSEGTNIWISSIKPNVKIAICNTGF